MIKSNYYLHLYEIPTNNTFLIFIFKEIILGIFFVSYFLVVILTSHFFFCKHV